MAKLLVLWALPLALLFIPSTWLTTWPLLRQISSLHLAAYSAVTSGSLGFDPREATIASTHYALYNGLSTCRQVVSSFISRIEALDNHTHSIINLNPHALDVADELDRQLRSGKGKFGALFCIPVLLKDNFDTLDMPTTNGNLALVDSRPSIDAASVTAMKEARSIILGKANLHELALEGLTVSSVAGQTLNPYDYTRTPGGSSGGTGAAVAASFSVWGTGTDTVNSLRSPANANSLFTCRPTRGLISRAGIVPVSYVQDSIGPIARTVYDVAVALTVMASVGYDERDNITALAPQSVRNVDYTVALASGTLKGLRLGVVEGFFNRADTPETQPVNQAMANMLEKLQAAGATLIPINDSWYDSGELLKLDVQRFTYRESTDAYLQQESFGGQHPSSLAELLESGQYLVVPSGYQFIDAALRSSSSNTTYATALAKIANLTLALQQTFAEHDLDALIYPQQRNLVMPVGSPIQAGRNGILAALTGSPVVAVPAAFSQPSSTAPVGVPIGMEILGRPFTEKKLLQIACQIERMFPVRKPPQWAMEAIAVKEYDAVPRISHEQRILPVEYPLGVRTP